MRVVKPCSLSKKRICIATVLCLVVFNVNLDTAQEITPIEGLLHTRIGSSIVPLKVNEDLAMPLQRVLHRRRRRDHGVLQCIGKSRVCVRELQG